MFFYNIKKKYIYIKKKKIIINRKITFKKKKKISNWMQINNILAYEISLEKTMPHVSEKVRNFLSKWKQGKKKALLLSFNFLFIFRALFYP